MLDLWEETRNEILDLGNRQMRSVDNFTDTTKYVYNLKMFKPGDDSYEN